jgi:predicted ester cyclase
MSSMQPTLDSTAIRDSAARFFHACETGQGWDVCKAWCHADATFRAQADALSGVETLEAYTEWVKSLFTPMPDARYELRSFAVDVERGQVLGYAAFLGTHTADGGPVAPTGRAVEADYVYVMEFDGDRIRHMTKIWNDVNSLQQLGWA